MKLTDEQKKLHVAISRIPESIVEEMENYFESIITIDEDELDPHYLTTLRMVIIGYGAAWDELEGKTAALIAWKSEAERQKRLRVATERLAGEQKMRHQVQLNQAAEVLQKAESFIGRILTFYGQGLLVLNWHQNGEPEPWDNFFDENMDGDELELIQNFLSSLSQEGGNHDPL